MMVVMKMKMNDDSVHVDTPYTCRTLKWLLIPLLLLLLIVQGLSIETIVFYKVCSLIVMYSLFRKHGYLIFNNRKLVMF